MALVARTDVGSASHADSMGFSCTSEDGTVLEEVGDEKIFGCEIRHWRSSRPGGHLRGALRRLKDPVRGHERDRIGACTDGLVITAAVLAADPEPYEGVIVELCGSYQVTGLPGYGEVETTRAPLDDELSDHQISARATFTSMPSG
jgi:hypothetical protein